jgi:hypothetical protein
MEWGPAQGYPYHQPRGARMNHYLAKLHALEQKGPNGGFVSFVSTPSRQPLAKKVPPQRTDKTDKTPRMIADRGFVSFVSTQSSRISTPEDPTSANRRPPQNLYSRAIEVPEHRCPDLVDAGRWQRAVEDSRQFLATWGAQAEALGWTIRELFGLHPVPDKLHPSFQRLSRYDSTGLIWLLGGRLVVALTDSEAAIKPPQPHCPASCP